MNRTFPDNVQFQKGADPCLQKALYNVLLAYGRHNLAVGYCQVSPGEAACTCGGSVLARSPPQPAPLTQALTLGPARRPHSDFLWCLTIGRREDRGQEAGEQELRRAE